MCLCVCVCVCVCVAHGSQTVIREAVSRTANDLDANEANLFLCARESDSHKSIPLTASCLSHASEAKCNYLFCVTTGII